MFPREAVRFVRVFQGWAVRFCSFCRTSPHIVHFVRFVHFGTYLVYGVNRGGLTLLDESVILEETQVLSRKVL